MKRSWTTIALAAGLGALLVILGALQYRWQVQVSDADREKVRKQVKDDADRFASDFNREIQNAYFNFQTEPASWKVHDWSAFNERYDYWRERSAYPELISGFYFIPAKSGEVMKYDAVHRAFLQATPDADISSVRTRLADETSFKPVYEDLLMLVMPIHEPGKRVEHIVIRRTPDKAVPPELSMPPQFGWLAIKLNGDVIKQRLVPDLAARYFGDGAFRIGIDDRDGAPVWQDIAINGADATAKLLVLSPDNFIFFANKELMSSLGDNHEAMVLNSRVESHTLTNGPEGGQSRSLNIELQNGQNGARPRTQFFTSASVKTDESPWTLAVQHSSGSIDTAAAAALRKDLAGGFGLLLLLAGAVGAIIVSAVRAKRFAQRQIDFVSSVSHEFRTPISVIYSAGENLADGVACDRSQVSRYGELIKGEGRKLSSMVEQILDFAGARSGRRRFAFADVRVNDVIANAVDGCRALLDEKHFDVQMALSEPMPTINADPTALSNAIQNLIANSVKYSNGSSWLRIASDNGGGSIRVTVEDRGIGMSKVDVKHAFEPFYRSKDVVDAQIHGNGLGLSIVRQIVEAHKGKVMVESEPGKGSKFTIELPVLVHPIT